MTMPEDPAARIPMLILPTMRGQRCFPSQGPRLARARAGKARTTRILPIRPERREAAMNRRSRSEAEGASPARLGCWGQAAMVALFLVIFLLVAPRPW
jgi:hypothetical protein